LTLFEDDEIIISLYYGNAQFFIDFAVFKNKENKYPAIDGINVKYYFDSIQKFHTSLVSFGYSFSFPLIIREDGVLFDAEENLDMRLYQKIGTGGDYALSEISLPYTGKMEIAYNIGGGIK
jgi:hypothetical protein